MHSPANSVRIIAGKWRRKRLSFPEVAGLRPTSDRIRETLFNWLQKDIHDATCLDVFAGSGALGFEALSRGARHVTFIDHNAQVTQYLNEHAKELNAVDQCDVINGTLTTFEAKMY